MLQARQSMKLELHYDATKELKKRQVQAAQKRKM